LRNASQRIATYLNPNLLKAVSAMINQTQATEIDDSVLLSLMFTQEQPTYKNVNLLGLVERMPTQIAAWFAKDCYAGLTAHERDVVRLKWTATMKSLDETIEAMEPISQEVAQAYAH
jgi:hypothetical protein